MKVYDTFLFNNEIELLMIRLMLLNSLVDYFVICESNYSITGRDRKVSLNLEHEQFKNFKGKIIHLISSDSINDDPWINENNQRNFIHKKLDFNFNDIIIHSDLDEIPNPKYLSKVIKYLMSDNNNKVYNLSLENFIYNINFKLKDPFFKLHDGVKVFKGSLLSEIPKMKFIPKTRNLAVVDKTFTFSMIRYYGDVSTIVYGGWHFTNFLDKVSLRQKLIDFTHQELFICKFINEISDEMLEKIIDHGIKLESINDYRLNYREGISKSVLFVKKSNLIKLFGTSVIRARYHPRFRRRISDGIVYICLGVFNLLKFKTILIIRKIAINFEFHNI